MGAMDREAFVLKHINSPMSPEYMKYLLEHDTVHGRFPGTCEVTEDGLLVNGLPVSLSATRDPTEIPWKAAGVDYVRIDWCVHNDRGLPEARRGWRVQGY